MKLHIIRHGDPDYANDSLTPWGKKEAEALSLRMAELPLQALYCSPLGRAKETASYTEKCSGLEAKVLPWARELHVPPVAHGDENRRSPTVIWDIPAGMLREAEQMGDKWAEYAAFSHPETGEAVEAVRCGWETLLAECGIRRNGDSLIAEEPLPEGDMALFCHHGLGLALLGIILDLPVPAMWRAFWLPPSSVSTVLFERQWGNVVNPRMVCVGDTSHLYREDVTGNTSGLIYNVK